jgi:hypothetical protein
METFSLRVMKTSRGDGQILISRVTGEVLFDQIHMDD